MLANELRQYIIDNNKTQHVVEKFGCHGFKEFKKEYRCGLPSSNNTTSVSIYKDSLITKIFKPDSDIVRGDIFTLCMDIFNISFVDANKKIHEILDLKYSFNKKKKEEKKVNILDVFERASSKNKVYVNDINIYDDDILSDIISLPHINWIREGIMPWTCEVFNIGYSPKHRRITIPHRYWCGTKNEYLGIMGRTVIENYDIFDIPKYFPLKAFPKSMNIYALQENYKGIQEAGYIVVFESEKSPLRRHSLGDYTGVALGGHELSDEQIKILIGLNVEIIIAMDKDVPEEHVVKMCNNFKDIRKVSYIKDEFNVLKPKDSPADARDKIYKILLNRRIKL